MKKIGVFSSGLRDVFVLSHLLGFDLEWSPKDGSNIVAVVCWGRKITSRVAIKFAYSNRIPYLILEDGFLRSFGTGEHFPPLSLVVDELGIFYDSTEASSLETLLASDVDVLAGLSGDVARARAYVLEHGLSKYNHAGVDCLASLAMAGAGYAEAPRVLVIDQTAGDMSVALGGASGQTFADMLAAARAENPQATIYVKTHPEVSSGRKGGYLTHVQDGVSESGQRTVVLRGLMNPLRLIEQMDRVYVVSSTMGFEALLAGKPVTCFGVPWYAGWGVTDDRCADSSAWARRTRRRSVDELFAAAYFHYTRYLNPLTHERGSIFDVMHWLVNQKRMAQVTQGDRGRTVAVGFRRWKAANLKPMLGLDSSRVLFVATAVAAERLGLGPDDRLVIWGRTPPPGLADVAQRTGARLVRLEDGFVRSVGLGSDLIRPHSLVMDSTGLYFDPTQPSDLEHVLGSRAFTGQDLQRAQAVRAFMVAHGLTKYNLEPRAPVQWASGGRRVVLVPGQVEDDASIRFGCTTVNTNAALLQAARLAQPEGFIVYKPHPDVVSGNRAGRMALAEALRWAHHVEAGASVVSCLDACDEVHTMTSLTGFDALLRGKTVVTYGQPFYAGWGLTHDRAGEGGAPTPAFERRSRRLTLDELVAGTLLHYPVYWDWTLKGYTTCEAVLNTLLAERTALESGAGLERLRSGWWRRQGRKLGVLWRAWKQS
jgi:capsular polysaccharide export protein